MTHANLVQRTYSSGEISPTLHFRPDYQRFQTGLRACRGFLPMVEGGFTRAPGTLFRGFARANVRPRLISFQFASNDALVLEFTPGIMRVWRYGVLVQKADDTGPYELVTPFDADSLPVLSWVQSADVIYITDGRRPIQRLARYALNSWTIGPATFTGPFRAQNLDEAVTVIASAATGSITLTASEDLFHAEHVSVPFHIRAQHYSDIPLWTGETTMSIGQIVRNDGKLYRYVRPVSGVEVPDYSTGTIGFKRSGGSMKTGVNAPVHEDGTQQVSLDPLNWWEYLGKDAGIVRITSVTNARLAHATVVEPLPPNVVTDSTYRWSEGAWSDLRGWPACVEIHEQRFVGAGTPSEPRTVWFSMVGDYAVFSPGTEADDAFAYAISGQASLNRIMGLKSGKRGLHIFALGQEFSSRSDASAQYLSATTSVFRVDSGYGSRAVPAIAPDGDPIFITRDGRRVMMVGYDFQQDANRSTELSRAAQHLGAAGFSEIAWQSSPQRMCWLRRDDGDLVAMLYDPAEEVIGWAVLPCADGNVVSIAVTPAAQAGFDTVMLAIEREVNGETVCMIEELSDVHAFLAGSAGPFDANHLFAALSIAEETPTAAFSLPHLIGAAVYAWTDAGEFGPIVVPESGEITLPAAATRGFVGLFDATHFAETLDVQVPSPIGDTTGKKRRITSAAVALHRTAQGYIRAIERDPAEAERARARTALLRVPVSSDLTAQWSGIAPVDVACGSAVAISLRIEPHGAAPLTVLGIAPKVEVTV